MDYKDRSCAIRWIGVFFFLIGLGAAILGPVEMYCFYLFGNNGPFHYDGFGFGSLVFASIAWQIIGYYLIAFLSFFLAIGHLRLRKWARTWSVAGLGAWFTAGFPLTLATLALLLAFKELSVGSFVLIAIAGVMFYPGLPVILYKFYHRHDVEMTFQNADNKIYWFDRLPNQVRILGLLIFFFWLLGHVPIFFNGVFPLYGFLISGLAGIAWTTGVLMCLLLCLWGLMNLKPWGWWGILLTLCFIITTILTTFVPLSFQDMVAAIQLPPIESQALQNVPLRGSHIAFFIIAPLLVTVVILMVAKPAFRNEKPI